MDVFSTELGIRLGFVKTSEFRGGEPPAPFGTPLLRRNRKGKIKFDVERFGCVEGR
jgi:hypothetical protein